MSPTTPLTVKQENFCLAYLMTGNASEAYRRSYSAGKMTAKQVHEEACKLAASPKVAQRIVELREASTTDAVMAAQEVLEETSRLARFDVRKLFRADGSPIPVNELDDETAAAIAGIEVLEQWEGSGKDRVFVGYVKKYRIADKNAALDKLFRHHGLYEKDNRRHPDPFAALPAETVAEIMDRLRELRDSRR